MNVGLDRNQRTCSSLKQILVAGGTDARSKSTASKPKKEPVTISEIVAWEKQRNAARARIKWMFTTDKARAKMSRAYPVTPKES